jgi:hypothetical protein
MGHVLPITPNHPVLTSQGWVSAGLLVKGADVVGASFRQSANRSSVVIPNDHQEPAFIEDIARTLGCQSGVMAASVPSSSEQFHGDGVGSKVSVVRANRDLMRYAYASLTEPDSKQLFGRTSGQTAELALSGNRHLVGESVMAASTSRMRPRSVGAALLRSSIGTSEVGGFLDRPERDTSLSERSGDDIAIDPLLLAESLDRYAIDVQADEVVEVRRYPFRGHVYSLQTTDGWYLSNGIATHNCPCVEFWRHMLNDTADASYTARMWQENTELLEANRRLAERVRVLEADLRTEHMHWVA